MTGWQYQGAAEQWGDYCSRGEEMVVKYGGDNSDGKIEANKRAEDVELTWLVHRWLCYYIGTLLNVFFDLVKVILGMQVWLKSKVMHSDRMPEVCSLYRLVGLDGAGPGALFRPSFLVAQEHPAVLYKTFKYSISLFESLP